MRISDWSSDVCSSDLRPVLFGGHEMVVTIEPDKVLLSRDFLHRLGRRVGELELSRMKSTDWLATVLYGWDGVILDADGNPFEIDDEMIDFSYRSEEHTSELQSLMRISYAVFCLKKQTI